MSARACLRLLRLRNVKAIKGTTSRFYRIYCQLELNLRIKPHKRLKRDKPDALTVSKAPTLAWSVDAMADRRGVGRAFRLLNAG